MSGSYTRIPNDSRQYGTDCKTFCREYDDDDDDEVLLYCGDNDEYDEGTISL